MGDFDEYEFLEQLADDVGLIEGYGLDELDETTPEPEPPSTEPEPSSKQHRKKKPKSDFIASCSECKRHYKTLNGYKNHLKSHKMTNASKGVPDMASLIEESTAMSREVLESMHCDLPAIGYGVSLKQLICSILTKTDSTEWSTFMQWLVRELSSCLPQGKLSPGRGTTYPMPSEIRYVYTKGVACMLTTSIRKSICMKLTMFVSGYSDEVCGLFMSGFVRRFSNKMLSHILKSMRLSVAPANRDINANKKHKSDAEMKEFKEITHFIAGSVIRRVLNGALPLSEKYSKWDAIVYTIKEFLLVVDPAVSSTEELMAWTKAQDRGGLIYINTRTLDFFAELGCIAENLEKDDGSLKYSDFKEKVMDSRAYQLWDGVILSSLPLNDSVFLMDMCSLYFTQTWGAGTAKKHMNMWFSRGTTSVALRPGLAKNK